MPLIKTMHVVPLVFCFILVSACVYIFLIVVLFLCFTLVDTREIQVAGSKCVVVVGQVTMGF